MMGVLIPPRKPGLALPIDGAQDPTVAERGGPSNAVVHQAGRRELQLPTGLPSLPRVLAEARSYAQRLYAFHTVQRLPEPLSR